MSTHCAGRAYSHSIICLCTDHFKHRSQPVWFMKRDGSGQVQFIFSANWPTSYPTKQVGPYHFTHQNADCNPLSEHGNHLGKHEIWDEFHKFESGGNGLNRGYNPEVAKSYQAEKLRREERKLIKDWRLKPQQESLPKDLRNGCFLGYNSLSLQNAVSQTLQVHFGCHLILWIVRTQCCWAAKTNQTLHTSSACAYLPRSRLHLPHSFFSDLVASSRLLCVYSSVTCVHSSKNSALIQSIRVILQIAGTSTLRWKLVHICFLYTHTRPGLIKPRKQVTLC